MSNSESFAQMSHLDVCKSIRLHNSFLLNPLRGKPTYMSPKVKRYTDLYVILTYTCTETHVLFGIFIPEILFFGQGLKFFLFQ